MSLPSLPLRTPASDWAPPQLASLPSWHGARRVSLDTETRDPHLRELGPGVRRGAEIVGISFAIEDGPGAYLPIRHRAGGNLEVEGVLRYLREQAAQFAGELVGANLPYDLDFLQEAGVVFRPSRLLDVQVIEPLLDELQDSYSLESIAERRGLPGKSEGLLQRAAAALGVDPKADLWRMHSRHVGPYAEQDARLPLALLRRQERVVAAEGLEQVVDLETRLTPVLLRMRRTGVRFSYARLASVEEWLLARELEALAEVRRLTGHSLVPDDMWHPEPLAAVLRYLGVVVPLTPKTGKPSVSKGLLAEIDHPVARMLARARKMNKVRTTYAASIREHAIGDRIHPSFRQGRSSQGEDEEDDGARFGRLSSCDPNLQQQPGPGRDKEVGPLWRGIFIPEDGEVWGALDYAQQEPRWLVHFAALLGCRGAAEALAEYQRNVDLDYHNLSASITGLPRSQAKEILLGICYGMGGGKLCRKLKLPTRRIWSRRRARELEVAGPEGEAMMRRFDEGMPFVRELATRCEEKATRTAYIRTVLGRRCRFPLDERGEVDGAHRALNRLVQGSSGDQTKMAMVVAEEERIPFSLQMHDEMDGSFRDRAATEPLAEVMRTSAPCTVPMKVDVEVGPSWGEAA